MRVEDIRRARLHQGLFHRDTVTATGLRLPEGKELGINSLTANILCKRHNSDLSPLDAEAIALSHATRTFRFTGKSARVTLRGDLLQRWLLKVSMGTASSGMQFPKKGIAHHPDIIDYLFGFQACPDQICLATVTGIGIPWNAQPLNGKYFFEKDGDKTVGYGFLYCIQGVPLMLCCSLSDPQALVRARLDKPEFAHAEVDRRPDEVHLQAGEAALSIALSRPPFVPAKRL